MTSPAAAGNRPARRGKLVVLLILGLGVLFSIVKIAQELAVGPHVRGRIEKLREELASRDPRELLARDHEALRDLLLRGGAYAEFIKYRDRAIPLLEEAFRKDRDREGYPPRSAWLLLLLRIDSPRSRRFFEEELSAIAAPDLRREVESYLERHRGSG